MSCAHTTGDRSTGFAGTARPLLVWVVSLVLATRLGDRPGAAEKLLCRLTCGRRPATHDKGRESKLPATFNV